MHDYLGMELDFHTKGEVKIGMTKYVKKMLEDFPVKLKSKDVARTPAGDTLFQKGSGGPLDKTRSKIFHTMIAKGLFLCKRA